MRLNTYIPVWIIIASSLTTSAFAGDDAGLAAEFQSTVLPLLRQHCLDCHGVQNPEAMFDLSRFSHIRDVARDFATWQHVVDRVGAGEMPPAGAEQPSRQTRTALLNCCSAFGKN